MDQLFIRVYKINRKVMGMESNGWTYTVYRYWNNKQINIFTPELSDLYANKDIAEEAALGVIKTIQEADRTVSMVEEREVYTGRQGT